MAIYGPWCSVSVSGPHSWPPTLCSAARHIRAGHTASETSIPCHLLVPFVTQPLFPHCQPSRRYSHRLDMNRSRYWTAISIVGRLLDALRSRAISVAPIWSTLLLPSFHPPFSNPTDLIPAPTPTFDMFSFSMYLIFCLILRRFYWVSYVLLSGLRSWFRFPVAFMSLTIGRYG